MIEIQDDTRAKSRETAKGHWKTLRPWSILIYVDHCWSCLNNAACCLFWPRVTVDAFNHPPSDWQVGEWPGITSQLFYTCFCCVPCLYTVIPKSLVCVCASVLWQKHHTWYIMAVKVLKGSVVCSPGCTTSTLLLISCSSVTSVNHSLSALATQSCGQGRGGDRWQVTVPSQMMEAFGLRI